MDGGFIAFAHRLCRGIHNLPSLFLGYNLHVNPDKLQLINLTFRKLYPGARSFADLGGVWHVDAAYCHYTLRTFPLARGVIVDTDFPSRVRQKLAGYPNLLIIAGDFGSPAIVEQVGSVDVIYLFDVLLHQANPDWDEILRMYASNCRCFIIYNPQLVGREKPIRLTDLPPDEYVKLTSTYRNLHKEVYARQNELHPEYHKPWKDIHNIAQWGITDSALRMTMAELGYQEVFFRNYGKFRDRESFENHGFVFIRPASC